MTVTLQNTAQSMHSMRQHSRIQREQYATYRALSSGRRVHRAAEDAAGLAVSETLDAQVRSQSAAQRNVNDGLSMIQTAEGGLREMSDMVKRMRELAVQAASETMSDTERRYAQEEFGALSEEIVRIQKNTSFGGTNLLDGSWKGEIQVGIHGDANHRIEVSAMQSYEVHTRTSGPWEGTEPANFVSGYLREEASLPNGSPPGSSDHARFSMAFTVDGDTFDLAAELGISGEKFIGTAASIAAEINTVMTAKGYDIEAFDAVSRFESEQSSPKTSLRFKVGDGHQFDMTINHGHLTSPDDDKVGWSRETSDNSSWWDGGLDNYTQTFSAIGPGGGRIDTVNGARDAIGQMDRTLDRYNQQMATFGAKHRRLESAGRSLATSRENKLAAKSRIIDADFAYQSAQKMRTDILGNAATAVLAQTNTNGQALLRLL